MTFGEKLKQLRSAHNLTQDQLAEKLIVTRQTVSKWELDVNEPDIGTLNKLAEIFNVSVDELICCKQDSAEKRFPVSLQLFLSNILVSLFCAFAIFVLVIFLQDTIPAHWNAKGEIDRYGSKFEVLLHLATFAVMTAMCVVTYFATKRHSQKAATVCQIVFLCVNVCYLAFALILHGKYLQENCLIRFVNCLAGCLIFTVSVAMHPKLSRQNYLLGVRTNLTLNNPTAWNKINKAACFCICFGAALQVALNCLLSQSLVSFLSFLVYPVAIAVVAIFHHCVAKLTEKDNQR